MGAAKKPTKENPVVFTSAILKHTNLQTMGADATVESGEALNTPGVSDGGNGAMWIDRIMVQGGPLVGTFVLDPAVSAKWVSQIQTGDRSVVPACLEPVSPFLLASTWFNSNGASSIIMEMPFDVEILNPEPIIVMDQYTIVHQGVNNAGHNDEDIYTTVWYRTAQLDDSIYNRILRNQTRLS